MQRVGAPEFGEEARDFARTIQQNLDMAPMDNPFIDDNERLLSPGALEARQRPSLPPGQLHIGADDYVEYTWHAPTVRLFNMRPTSASRPTTAMNIPPGRAMRWVDCLRRSIQGCSWAQKRLPARFSICSPIRPSWRGQVRVPKPHRRRRGGNKWVAPLLPRDFDPPVDLRWPEYVTTVRRRNGGFLRRAPVPAAARLDDSI